LVVDEAQNLSEPVLETVRLLSNFETPHTKLLQIVLAGQSQLTGKLAQPRLTQLRQRIAVLSHLAPLTAAETVCYVEHRLKVAGYCGEPLFASEALELIARRSQGIPRNINNICYNSLLTARAQESPKVTSEIVQRAIGEVSIELIAPQSSLRTTRTQDLVTDSDPRPASNFHSKMTPQLTYAPAAQFSLARWALVGVFLGVLLAGGSLLFRSYFRSGNPRQDSPSSSTPVNPADSVEFMPRTYAAVPEDLGSGQVLTVVARPEQTIKEISLLYVGHFDSRLLENICALNPELKDPDHIEPGQLIRLPLPPGTLRKVIDTSEITSASEGHNSESRFAKVRAFLVGKKW